MVLVLVLSALSGAAALGPPVSAGVVGEVISAANATTGRAVLFSAIDGSQRREPPCGGSLSNRFPNGTRYFAFAKEVMPGHHELYAVDEDCRAEIKLAGDPTLNIRPGTISLSTHGNRIAFHATQTQTTLLGTFVTEGLFVGTVVRDSAGGPQGVSAIKFAFSMQRRGVSWSGDEQRVTFHQELPSQTDPSRTQWDLFMGNVDKGSVVNLTNSATSEYHPAFSPTDDRIAFVKQTSNSGNLRNDIFVFNPTTGAVSQLTNRGNASAMQILHPSYSPDGKSISFSGWPPSGVTGANIYRLAADGSGKAVDLTSSSSDIHYVPQWRS